MKKDGCIKVSGFINNNKINFKIIDNGKGMEKDKLNQLLGELTALNLDKGNSDSNISNSIGIINVYKRLKLYFGEEAELKIESKLKKGTIVKLKVPLIE